MDPITIATMTAALTTLAEEAAKGMLGEAGKDAWTKVKSWFGWKSEPDPAQLKEAIEQRLQQDDQLVARVVALLQKQQLGAASALVGMIIAKNVVVVEKNEGPITFNN